MATKMWVAGSISLAGPTIKDQKSDGRQSFVTIGKDGQISLGSDAIDKSALIDAIRAKLGDGDSRVIHIRGDKEVPFGDVVAVLDMLAANGLTRIAIVAQAKKSDAPASPPAVAETGGEAPRPAAPPSEPATNRP